MKSTIRLCLSDSVLLNVSGEYTTKGLWDKLGALYQSGSLVNNFFPWKKLYKLRMRYGHSMEEHLNTFNIVVSQLVSVQIKILDEYKCIISLLSLPDLWDNLVVAIGSNTTTLIFLRCGLILIFGGDEMEENGRIEHRCIIFKRILPRKK